MMSQEEYIAILFDDLGFDGPQRRAWLRAETGHAYADELGAWKRHEIIERLKELKAAQREPRARESAAEEPMLPFECP